MVKMHILPMSSVLIFVEFNKFQERKWKDLIFFSGLVNINPVSEDLGTVETAFVQNQNKTDYF